MPSGRLVSLAAMAATVAVVAGCGSVTSRGQAASTVAQRLLFAVDRQDGAAACALLAPDTAAEVAQSAQKDCAEAILNQNLEFRVVGSESGDGVEPLQQVVCGEFDLLVPPFGGAVNGCDQRGSVDPSQVAVDEGVPGLGFVGGAGGEAEMPGRVLLPGVLVEV
jgi:hypothetical protein